jgi:glycosyl transferase, family 25
MFDFIDHVIYINLDHRIDRREHVESELLRVFEPSRITRFSAIQHPFGALGCSKSHIEVLKLAKKSTWRNVLIIEDDFEWCNLDNSHAIDKFTQLANNPYDVILLCGAYTHYYRETNKLISSKTTTSYLVNSHYYDKLLANFIEGFKSLNKTHISDSYALDVYWNLLMRTDNWFIVMPQLGK